ncbi:Cys-tRNA(Pro) deacylase [Frischella sp. Ac13]|uniref:Cys-tRNA(Pro)/Cys-tRNA(Cys) deacylase n=1 Tax=Frischella japonica TaxID=2741544 RepID=A0ABR7QV64_9GAMM|nr:Cys-tRNA(Pro) deacylase [Frischella japonica]MBC9130025.1 Cys-tRNA(Pro) deacylase [Frischella japonica]
MTPAINILKKLNIPFHVHHYQHDTNEIQFGKEAVAKLDPNLSITAKQVFKTLVVSINSSNKDLAVCIVPVDCHLNLKKAARAFNCKKIDLADANLAEKITGYLVGGISPIGQKKMLPTLIDQSANQFNTIFISGGRRGLEIEIAPHDLAKIIHAQLQDIVG